MIMSREARLSYHGVPRVLEGTFNRKRFEDALIKAGINIGKEVINYEEKNDFNLPYNQYSHVLKYLENSRININIRQVFLTGQEDMLLGKKSAEEKEFIENKQIEEMIVEQKEN